MRVLLAEDENTLSKIIKYYLEKEGFIVDIAEDGEEAIKKSNQVNYNFFILDLKLPKKNGFEVCRDLRGKGSEGYIIMMTSAFEDFRVDYGLNIGADDYIRKPFELSELLSRMYAITRRTQSKQGSYMQYGDINIDQRAHRVFCGDKEVKLNPKEYSLLVYFVCNQDRIISAEEIIENVWGEELVNVNSNSLEVYIHRLRKILKDCKICDGLVTVRGHGYQLRKIKNLK